MTHKNTDSTGAHAPSAKQSLSPFDRAISMPIVMSSSFQFRTIQELDAVYEGEMDGYIYTRSGNPNHVAVGEAVATMEGCEAGCVLSSGMAAITMSLLTLLEKGDHVVASAELYGETYLFLRFELQKFGIETTFIHLSDPEFPKAFRENTKVVYIETISNPLIGVSDISATARIAHEKGCVLLIDNTFASPAICRPGDLGADIIIHSGTKYLCGHGDLTMGIVCGRKAEVQRISETATLYGALASPFDCWLMLRSLKTLHLRMKKHSENALTLAKFFRTHPAIHHVNYPGLETSASHGRAKEQFTEGLYGGMLSIELKGTAEDAISFLNRLSGIRILPSLADVTTTVILPAKTSHRNLSKEDRASAGISEGLVRVSVGLEEVDDLIQRFSEALGG